VKDADNGHAENDLVLTGLDPAPEEQWRHLRAFLALDGTDLAAMVQTVEPLLRHGSEFVAGAYDYLLRFKETAAILGWDHGADPAHLAERRRFFSIWHARVIGLDLSDDLARYLFRAGKYHAGHGPRQIHVPEIYIAGAISLAQANFASYISSEITDAALVARALSGWNKLLTMHQHVMTVGYRAARALDSGPTGITVKLFGRMRDIAGTTQMNLHVAEGGRSEQVLQKFFNYLPEARPEVLDTAWADAYRLDEQGTPWLETQRIYRPRRDWNIRLNGRNLEYSGGMKVPVHSGDELSIFPPGR
jgi:molybdopterin converting factor small subunit